MHLIDLEKKLIKEFFKYENINQSKNLTFDDITVSKRVYTGTGFLTYLNKIEKLKILNDQISYKWGKLGAKINENVDVGFLVYVDKGFLITLEGYTYDIEWPNNINSIEFYIIENSL